MAYLATTTPTAEAKARAENTADDALRALHPGEWAAIYTATLTNNP